MNARTPAKRSLVLVPLLAATVLGPAGPARAEHRPDGRGAYVAVMLRRDGTAEPDQTASLAARLTVQAGGELDHVAVLVHGFDVEPKRGEEEYARVAAELRQIAGAAGLRMGVVGVHWDSRAGRRGKWLLQAAGHRVASLLGAGKRVRNPYLERVETARESGRQGLRQILFALRDGLPGARVHALAHSMGAELVVHALVPSDASGGLSYRPDRLLRLDTAVLAGADLDHDFFARQESPRRVLALRRAELWWVTVAPEGRADGVLELRRGAGRGDAVGNRGLRLHGEDLSGLLSRRGLVLDDRGIPRGHSFLRYFDARRLADLTAAAAYLSDPESPAARESVLGRLDSLLRGVPAGEGPGGPAAVRLYASWLAGAPDGELPGVRLLGSLRSGPTGRLPARVPVLLDLAETRVRLPRS